MESSEHALELRDLRFAYRAGAAFALTVPRLTVRPGECVFLQGRSGCGKTTLLRILAGLVGDSGAAVRSVFPHVMFVMHQPTLVPWRTVLGNGRLEERLRRRAGVGGFKRLCLQMGLEGSTLDLFPGALSLGMRQRVELARALAFDPNLILLDEALSGLDRAAKVAARNAINAAMVSRHLAVVATAHDILDVLAMADRVWPMDGGCLQESIEISVPRAMRAAMSPTELLRLPEATELLNRVQK